MLKVPLCFVALFLHDFDLASAIENSDGESLLFDVAVIVARIPRVDTEGNQGLFTRIHGAVRPVGRDIDDPAGEEALHGAAAGPMDRAEASLSSIASRIASRVDGES